MASEALQLLVNPGARLGSTDEECCERQGLVRSLGLESERKSCKDWKCSDATKWVHRTDPSSLLEALTLRTHVI